MEITFGYECGEEVPVPADYKENEAFSLAWKKLLVQLEGRIISAKLDAKPARWNDAQTFNGWNIYSVVGVVEMKDGIHPFEEATSCGFVLLQCLGRLN